MLTKFFNMLKLKPRHIEQQKPVDVEKEEKAEIVHQAMTAPYVCEPAKPIVTIESMDEPRFVHAKVEKVEEPVVEEKPKTTRKTPAKKPTKKAKKTTK
jgi:hypothetical protein